MPGPEARVPERVRLLHASATPLLHDTLSESARTRPEAVALSCAGEQVTYRELDARANAFARALARRGVQRGDRVVVFGDNVVETVVAFWAVLKADAVVSIVNPLTKADKLAYLLNDCRAKALVADGRLAHAFGPAARQSPHLGATIVVGPLDGEATAGLPGVVGWAAAVDGEAEEPLPFRRNIDVDLAAIVYTSGSTGDPKGVMLTHRNMLTAATSISTYLELRPDDVVLCALPLAFDYGLYQVILSARVGARVVLERSFAFPAQVLRRVVEEGVTVFPGVPTIFTTLAGIEDLSRYDFSRVRTVTNTAAALHLRHVEALQRVFPRARLFSMYGLTECKRCTYLPPEDLARKPLSVGIAIPDTELWIVDEHDRKLGPNEVGQLVIRGATVMKGYWEKPEETARKLRPGPVPGELVLYTGDYCRLDEDGYLYFVSRMDDIIKSRGEKVAPAEVERALCRIPGVREAAVVGVPDELLGEAVKAFVVADEGVTLTARGIQVECQRLLESFMVPKHVEIVPELPRGLTGKIQKTGLV
jgi:amino acid adenylation domain-containing protein